MSSKDNCIIYARYSNEPLCDDLTVEEQVTQLREYAAAQQMEGCSVVSGTFEGDDSQRLSIRNLFHEVECHKPGTVLVTSCDRLSSDVEEFQAIAGHLLDCGANIHELEPCCLKIKSTEVLSQLQAERSMEESNHMQALGM